MDLGSDLVIYQKLLVFNIRVSFVYTDRARNYLLYVIWNISYAIIDANKKKILILEFIFAFVDTDL